MKYLIDTHLLLWAAVGSRRLPSAAHKIMSDDNNELLFSVASIWEISIKQMLGREDFKTDAGILRRSLLDNGYQELVIKGKHAVAVSGLPDLHKDPFDRMLITQARVEGITLLSADSMIAKYTGPIQAV